MTSKLLKRLLQKEDPTVYQLKDGNLDPTLTTMDLIGLGTGMVVGTAILLYLGSSLQTIRVRQYHWLLL